MTYVEKSEILHIWHVFDEENVAIYNVTMLHCNKIVYIVTMLHIVTKFSKLRQSTKVRQLILKSRERWLWFPWVA